MSRGALRVLAVARRDLGAKASADLASKSPRAASSNDSSRSWGWSA